MTYTARAIAGYPSLQSAIKNAYEPESTLTGTYLQHGGWHKLGGITGISGKEIKVSACGQGKRSHHVHVALTDLPGTWDQSCEQAFLADHGGAGKGETFHQFQIVSDRVLVYVFRIRPIHPNQAPPKGRHVLESHTFGSIWVLRNFLAHFGCVFELVAISEVPQALVVRKRKLENIA